MQGEYYTNFDTLTQLSFILHFYHHFIMELSKKLLPQEQSYAAIEKVCLAMVWALKKLQPYRYQWYVTVYTGHSPLTWLMPSC